jgi:hypothetical protein
MRVSGFYDGAKPAETLGFPHDSVGQSCTRHCPHRPKDEDLSSGTPQTGDALGEPLGVREVARVIGCSAWTVRHRYLPQGLPHFRSGPGGKLVFYRNQVVRWILQQQKKGGM